MASAASGWRRGAGSRECAGQGFFVGLVVAGTVPDGLALELGEGLAPAPPAPATGISSAWLMPSFDAQNRVAGSASVPGTTYIARRSVHSCGSTASRNWPANLPFDLSIATIRAFGLSSA